MSHRIKLLILDYGGVYSFGYTQHNVDRIFIDTFGKIPNSNERQLISIQSHLLGANKITTAEYIDTVGKILGTNNLPSVQLFEGVTIDVTNPPSPEMVALVQKVRKSEVKVSLLSDMYLFEAKLTRPWGRYDGFDFVSLSAEVGMTKNDPEVFRHTLSYFGLEANEALFVDDKLSNIEVAKSVGLATHWADKSKYTNAAQLADSIQQQLGF